MLRSLLFVFLLISGSAYNTLSAQQHYDIKTIWSYDSIKAPDSLEVEVTGLKEYDGDNYVVELAPKLGGKDSMLPVVIGTCEINGMYSTLHNVATPRPMTYDLVTGMLYAMGAKIDYVIITKLENNTYYALIYLDNNGKKVSVDARPSDAINLALRAGASIYVRKKVFDEAKEPSQQ